MSQVTSHILDTSSGKPAAKITVIMFQGSNDEWHEIWRSLSDNGGRIKFADAESVQHGLYKLRFETKDYYDKNAVPTFYPYVEIIFEINSNEHYHIPLLLSPFGYSTYRGS